MKHKTLIYIDTNRPILNDEIMHNSIWSRTHQILNVIIWAANSLYYHRLVTEVEKDRLIQMLNGDLEDQRVAEEIIYTKAQEFNKSLT